MNIEIKYAPAATVAVCHMNPQEKLVAEGGAFMALRGQVSMTTTTHQKSGGGFLKGLKRLFSGENFFLNHFEATSSSEVWLGTPLSGDILVHKLQGDKLIISSGGFVACEPSIEIDMQWQGMKSLFSGEGLFWIKASGYGQLILNSFGFIYPVDVDGEYIVDTGHIVAFEETLSFSISTFSTSWIKSFFSGEGLICRFKGRGRVWIQSHNPQAFGLELQPFLKVKNS